ncbi:hypothetical protein FHX74_002164 [Friedmanniella endophytica]|uniref:Uncharacterized protein n=1 Tax=Microlunatus kandeliicorticis TaxID=1759536 RepID=A0A7W3ISV3_9ACTN|nr:hypothetical protein [Microlunatus kandeliicorticis]MBA8794545.1 hypothetical protein [Microlunatus kandeliicorticis]
MTVFDIDPNVVKPGWTPFIITLVLAAVMVVLYRSMRRQFRRIGDLPSDEETYGRAPGPNVGQIPSAETEAQEQARERVRTNAASGAAVESGSSETASDTRRPG